MPVADHVLAVRPRPGPGLAAGHAEAPGFITELVQWGAGPRAGIYLILAAKARAILHGRYHATTEDVQGRGPAGPAAPRHHDVQRRGGRHHGRRGRRAPAGRDQAGR